MRGRAGGAHLAVLARQPRPAGGEAERAAREYAAGVLRSLGFEVRTEPFTYSSFPGRAATPLAGAIAAAAVLLAAWLGLGRDAAAGSLATIAIGLAAVGLFARRMLGDAVLELPWLRRASENLVATRGAEPRVWLVAHLDSKSQPVPSAGRVAGIVLVCVAMLLAVAAAAMQLAVLPARTLWWGALAALVVGAPLVMASVVGARSDGAVDNASGVAAVLAAAAMLPSDCAIGVLLPSAEELGLAGARAWARGHVPGTALNCDGVDDDGEVTVMYHGRRPAGLLEVMRGAARAPLRVRRMPLGLLTDSVALADRGWTTATVSRGSFATLRRVHTPADSLAALRGDGIDEVASLLARAAEALAR
jgi:hypothetical protein